MTAPDTWPYESGQKCLLLCLGYAPWCGVLIQAGHMFTLSIPSNYASVSASFSSFDTLLSDLAPRSQMPPPVRNNRDTIMPFAKRGLLHTNMG